MYKIMLKMSALSTLGNVISKSIVFFVSVLLSHKLILESFASYSLVYSLSILIGTVSAASFGTIITNKVSAYGESTYSLIKNRVLISFSISFFLAFLIFLLVDIKQFPNIFVAFFVFFVAFIYSLESMLTGGMVGKLMFKEIFLCNLLKGVFFIFSTFILAYNFGLLGAFLSLFFYVLFGFIVVFRMSLSLRSSRVSLEKNKDVIFEVLPLVITNIMIGGFLWSLNYYIYDNLSYEESGFFSVLLQVSQILLFIAASASHPILPMLNKINSSAVERLSMFVPSIAMGLLAVILYWSDLFLVVFGNDIVNDQNKNLVGVVLFTSVISVFKLSLFRKNIQSGKLYVSLLNNTIWLLLVFIFLYFHGLSLTSIFYSLLWAHMATTVTALYLYSRLGIVRFGDFSIKDLTLFSLFIFAVGFFLL